MKENGYSRQAAVQLSAALSDATDLADSGDMEVLQGLIRALNYLGVTGEGGAPVGDVITQAELDEALALYIPRTSLPFLATREWVSTALSAYATVDMLSEYVRVSTLDSLATKSEVATASENDRKREFHQGTQAISTIDGLPELLDTLALADHNHSDLYYSQAQIDEKLQGVETGGGSGRIPLVWDDVLGAYPARTPGRLHEYTGPDPTDWEHGDTHIRVDVV